MPVDTFGEERKKELGEFLDTIVGGIYKSIQLGGFDVNSQFYNASGRIHKSLVEMILEHKSTSEKIG